MKGPESFQAELNVDVTFYVPPVGDSLLIGFGRDADATGRVRGLQVSLFDVSKLADPRRLDVMQLSGSGGGWWSGSSAAEWDHHAFSYFADHQLLALPVLDGGWWTGQAKLDLIRIDSGKFKLIGQIKHTGTVLRSVQIGDFIYSIGTDAVKVVAIDAPGTELVSVTLPQDTSRPPDEFMIM